MAAGRAIVAPAIALRVPPAWNIRMTSVKETAATAEMAAASIFRQSIKLIFLYSNELSSPRASRGVLSFFMELSFIPAPNATKRSPDIL